MHTKYTHANITCYLFSTNSTLSISYYLFCHAVSVCMDICNWVCEIDTTYTIL